MILCISYFREEITLSDNLHSGLYSHRGRYFKNFHKFYFRLHVKNFYFTSKKGYLQKNF